MHVQPLNGAGRITNIPIIARASQVSGANSYCADFCTARKFRDSVIHFQVNDVFTSSFIRVQETSMHMGATVANT